MIGARMGVVVAVLTLASACGSGSSPAVPTGRPPATYVVTGHLEGVGGPGGHAPSPWEGTVTWTGTQHGTAGTDNLGRFTLRLPPGRYVLTGHSPQYGDGTYLCRAVGALVVTKGAQVRMDVLCQMK
jgi:hypothetical protein